jgi:RHS repeat-associated protein
VTTTASTSYSYDCNGNLTSSSGGSPSSISWNLDNLPISVTKNGVTESYIYNADKEREVRTHAGVTTVSFNGIWEHDVASGAQRTYYSFNGQTIAMRDWSTTPDTVTYLHGDHLGSVSLATSAASGTLANSQTYTPWGTVRTGAIPQTTLDFTGQHRDDTGLLYFHARYYDPQLGRFLSPDTMMPEPVDPQQLNRYS